MDEPIDYRFYWKHPHLISQLPEEQRKKVLEKFFELVEKSKKENDKRMSKIVKEMNLRHTITRLYADTIPRAH